ncbi:hypothetical protein FO519_004872 [Halicephalobus sp. NKZ332]|nr:hypothetical protein FO519_004872 [Halicephalobus sp. NKZ332]
MSPDRRSCSIDLAIYDCVHYPSGLPITPAIISKTVLCQKYLRTRRCSYGDYCKFAHSLSELHLEGKYELSNDFYESEYRISKNSERIAFDKAPGGFVEGKPIRPQRSISSSSDSSTHLSTTNEKHYLPLFGTVAASLSDIIPLFSEMDLKNAEYPFMSQDRVNWPKDMLKALSCPVVENAHKLVKRIIEFVAVKSERNLNPELQNETDRIFFGDDLPMSEKYKVTVFLVNVLTFEISDDRIREVLFDFVFLGGHRESPSHKNRMKTLAVAVCLAVQYPSHKFLECVASWLLVDGRSEPEGDLIVQSLIEQFVFVNPRYGLYRFVEDLRVTCLPLAAVILVYAASESNFTTSETAIPLINLLGKWLVKKTHEFVNIIKTCSHLSSELALVRIPIMLKYCCTNGVQDDDHDRFQVGLLKLMEETSKAKIGMNLNFLITVDYSKLNEVDAQRTLECAYTVVRWNLIQKGDLHREMQIKMESESMSCGQEYKKIQEIIRTLNDNKVEVDQILDLCDDFVAENRTTASEFAIEKAEALVAGGFIREDTLLNAYTVDFESWDQPEAVIQNCNRLKEILEAYKFDYTIALERQKFCARAFDFFIWMLDGIRYSLTKLEPEITGIQKIDQEVILRQANHVTENIPNYQKFYFDQSVISKIEKLPHLVKSALDGPMARVQKKNTNVVPENKPGVLTFGSIYACFKMNDTDFDVAEAVLIFSHSIGVPRVEMIVDLLRVGPLIQLKDNDPGRIALVDVFAFLRIPNILKMMVEHLNVKKEHLFEALKAFLNYKSLLNAVDLNNRCNYFEHLCSALVEKNLITDSEADELVRKRLSIIENSDELGEMLQSTELMAMSKLRKVRIAEQIASAVFSCLESEEKLLILMDKVLLKTDGTIERVCAVMSANGDLDGFVEKLIQINKRTETSGPNSPNLRGSRMRAFDVSFMILVKMVYMFNDLRLHDYPENSKFQLWWDTYESCLLNKSPMVVELEQKQSCAVHYDYVKNSRPFWTETSDLSTAIDSIPGIGELMMDECRRAFLKSSSDIEKVLIPFTELPCLLVCLIQWLETKLCSTENNYELAKFIDGALSTMKNSQNCNDQLHFGIYLVDYGLKHLIRKRLREPRYTWLVTSARRELPSLKHFEVPDVQVMKEAYIYSNQQAWASPDVIKLVANSNFKVWVHCWLNQILKVKSEDEVFSAVKLFLATGFIRGTSTLSEMSQQLVDLMTQAESPVTNLHCARPLTWLLVRLLILQIYMEQVRRRQDIQRRRNTLKRRRSQVEDDGNEDEVFNPPPTKLQKVEDMIAALNLKIDREINEALKEQIKKQYEYSYESQKEFERMQSIYIFDEDKPGVADLDLDEEPLPTGEFWPAPKIVHKLNHEPFRHFEEVKSPAAITSMTIFMTLKRIEKQVKVPVLRRPVTFAVYLLGELAMAPRSRFYYKFLLTYLWPEFFVYVTRVEPFGLSINEMLKLYDIRDKEQLDHLLYFACLKRRLGAA